MQKNKTSSRQYINLVLVLTLFSSLFAQIISPLNASAESAVDESQVEETVVPTETEGEFDLSIMHMNDTHARVENYPRMLTAIKKYRTENPESLLLHAGDVFSGTLYFNQFHGQADLALLNMMEFDAMVFGNHEYDLGKSDDGHKALSEFVKGANFPILGSNNSFTEDPNMKQFEPKGSLVENAKGGDAYNSIIVEREGEKIGLFGLTTEDTKDIASPVKITFSNYIKTAQEEVTKLEEAGIDKIIAITHLGFDSAPAVGNDLLLAKNVDGIDVIVGGHSHTLLQEPHLFEKEDKAPTVIVQAGQYAENLGTVEVTFDENGEVIGHSGKVIPVATRDQSEEPDSEALEKLAPFKEEVSKLSNEETGAVAQKELTNPRAKNPGDSSVRANETELGNLVTDAMLAKAKEKEPDTVIAFQNGGGIRNSIDEGPITVGEVISVLPFGNDPVVAELTGQEIKDILEHAVKEAPAENGGFLHISGMKYFYDSEKTVGNRIVKMFLVNADETKTEIDPKGNQTYKITTNGFTGQGGDGFDTFKEAYANGRVKDIGEIDWQQLRDYMVEEAYLNKIVDPVIEGRIIDLKGEPLPEEIKTGWVQVGSDWYYYGEPNVMKIGWVLVESTWYYMNTEGKMQTGWQQIDNRWFYMNKHGAMQKGWTKVGETWYYMSHNGAMETGWTKVNNTWYYMSNSGAMQTGWNKIGGTWYYMSNSGAMQTGWTKVSGTWYYMNSSGAMQTGWTIVGNKWYYMNSSGAMQTGWNKINNTWFYMNPNGAMQTGWTKVGETWYYMANSGAMQTGWNKVDGTWYYMANNGAMQTGWIQLSGNWYYLNKNGAMQTHSTTINGKWYRFHSSGRML